MISLKTCGVISAKYNLKEGKLSDYWAQEMIGADLLKQDLEAADPLPEDKPLVSVFDDPGLIQHDEKVKSLISDESPVSILPKLTEQQMSEFKTLHSSDYVKAVDHFLTPIPLVGKVKKTFFHSFFY